MNSPLLIKLHGGVGARGVARTKKWGGQWAKPNAGWMWGRGTPLIDVEYGKMKIVGNPAATVEYR